MPRASNLELLSAQIKNRFQVLNVPKGKKGGDSSENEESESDSDSD